MDFQRPRRSCAEAEWDGTLSRNILGRTVSAVGTVKRVVAWYFSHVYAQHEGPGSTPFYCDAARVGFFAVSRAELMRANDESLFRLFVTLAMYQGLRDVVIMRRQRSLSRQEVDAVTDVAKISYFAREHSCRAPRSPASFEALCRPTKEGRAVDCLQSPGTPCAVKDASAAFNRMADMGKLPTSAWLEVWNRGGLASALASVRSENVSPQERARSLVRRFSQIHRVGRKLASMFVSALSTPALAPDLTPWFPEIDGNDLVVVDTNVARAADALRAAGAPQTYDAREEWIREIARSIDLRAFRRELPAYSPRVVQQALYAFGSLSNRTHRDDSCAQAPAGCECVARAICPFAIAPANGLSAAGRPAQSRRAGQPA